MSRAPIACLVEALLDKRSKARRADKNRAPFKDPQNVDEFLADLQWLEDEVSHIPITLAPLETNKLHREWLTESCELLLRVTAAIRTICHKDQYDVWPPFASIVVEAIGRIREEGMEKMMKEKQAWRAFWLSSHMNCVTGHLLRVMPDVGHKDISDGLIEEEKRKHRLQAASATGHQS